MYSERRYDTSLSERVKTVNKGLAIKVSKAPRTDGMLACRRVTIREKLLSRLLGPPRRLMVLIPGDSVDGISVTEVTEGGESVEQD